MISELGGVTFLLILIARIIVEPFVRFSYRINAISSLFLARSSDQYFFSKSPKTGEDKNFKLQKEKDIKIGKTMGKIV